MQHNYALKTTRNIKKVKIGFKDLITSLNTSTSLHTHCAAAARLAEGKCSGATKNCTF
jgi:hypothetical protein